MVGREVIDMTFYSSAFHDETSCMISQKVHCEVTELYIVLQQQFNIIVWKLDVFQYQIASMLSGIDQQLDLCTVDQ